MPPDDVIDTLSTSGDAESKGVLDLILEKPPEEKKEPEKKVEAKAEAEVSDEESEEKPKPGPDSDEEEEDEEEEVDEKAEEGEEESDDLDAYLVDVTVDGKVQEVKLGDLKKNYSGNKFTDENMHKAIEARKTAEAQAQALFNVNTQVKSRLENLDKLLKATTESSIDWETLKKSDPQAYLLKREEVRETQDKQAAIRKDIERIDAEQAEIQAHATQQYLDNQAEILMQKLPALADPKQASVLMDELEEGAKTHFGYTKQEFKGIVDHRAMLILNDAVSWRKLQAQKKETKAKLNEEPEKKVLLRPSGTKQRQSGESRKLDQEAIRRAKSSGKPDDVAATLLIRKKG